MAPGWKFVGRPAIEGMVLALLAEVVVMVVLPVLVAYHLEHCCFSALIWRNADFRPASGRIELGVAISLCVGSGD